MDEVMIPITLFIMIAVIVVGLPIARAYARRMERGAITPSLPSADLIARLERIEQAIEAMAIEVERISEGQRFTTALLAEKKDSGTLPAADGTVLLPAARRKE